MNGAVDARDETDLSESRRLLAQAEELGGFGSYVYTPHTGKVIWSDGLYRLHGATRESFPDPGVDPLRFVHPDDRTQARRLIAEVAASGAAAELRHRMLCAGVTRWAVSRMRPDADDPDRLLGTVLDVTAEHDAQRRYQAIAARVPGMIFQLVTHPGSGSTLRFVSEGSRDVYGFGPDEVLADPGLISRLVEPGDLERQRAALAAGEPWTWEGRIVLPPRTGPNDTDEPQTRWLWTICRPSPHDPGGVLWDGLTIDRTEAILAEQRQAGQARELRAAREFLQAALENLSDAVVACDADGMLTLFNPAARRMHGPPEQPIDPDDWPSYYGLFNEDGSPMRPDQVPLRRALAGATVRRERLVVAHADGQRRLVEASGRRLYDGDGVVLGAVVAMHDVTDAAAAAEGLHQQAARLRAAIQAQREITEVSTDRDVTLTRVAERAMDLVPEADGGVVEILDGPDEFVYTSVTGTMSGYRGTRVKAAGSLSGLATTERRAQYCADTRTDPRVDAVTCERLGIAAMLIAPLFDADAVIGVVKVTSGVTDAFDENDRLQLELLAGAVGAALRHAVDFTARTAALAAARESEERFRSAFQNAPQGIAIVSIRDADRGTILSANPALCRMLGRPEGELCAGGFGAFTHPDDRERDARRIRASLSEGLSQYGATKRFRHADGHTVIAELHAAPLHDAEGRPTSMIVQVADVTEQLEADNRVRQQAELLDRTHDAIIVRGLDNVVRFWNAGATAMYGWPAGEAVGLRTHRLLHTRRVDGGTLADLDATLLAEGRWDGELKHLRADGSIVIVASRQTLQRDTEGVPSAILEINNDVSARRAAEDALAKREERFRTQFEQVAIGQSLTALDGQLIEVNDAYCAMLGRERSELIGTEYRGLMHPDQIDDRLQLAQLFAGRIPTYRRELQMMHADGSPIDVDARISLIRGDDGRPQAFLTQLIDITARRLAERERDVATAQLVQRNGQLEQSNRGLLAANQLKLDLMGMLSHEIGNPLTAIAGHAEVLLDLLAPGAPVAEGPTARAQTAGELGVDGLAARAPAADGVEVDGLAVDVSTAEAPAADRRLRSVQAILRGTERLATMRHEILTMCALDTGNIVANREPVALCSAIAQALAATELTVPVDCAPGLVALVSPSHLQHILINYLTNAAKYAGGATGVSASSSLDWIEIRVKDAGPGVEPQFRTHLFERFTRGSDAGARAQGTGLGLYIVQGLAEANDGTVWYEPNSPTGSVFAVRLRRLRSGNAAT